MRGITILGMVREDYMWVWFSVNLLIRRYVEIRGRIKGIVSSLDFYNDRISVDSRDL